MSSSSQSSKSVAKPSPGSGSALVANRAIVKSESGIPNNNSNTASKDGGSATKLSSPQSSVASPNDSQATVVISVSIIIFIFLNYFIFK